MEAKEIECHRSDHLHEPGKISEQMFREIQESDVCVALLAEQNPNVFYELALAQAWNRPVIVLVHAGQEIPFDIKDIRCVEYDLKPRNLFEKVFVQSIVSHLESLESLNWQVPSAFGLIQGTHADPLEPVYFERYSQYGSSENWIETLGQARQRCDLSSVALDSWKNRTGFSDLVLSLAQSGCRVRLLQMHPENPTLVDFATGAKSHEYLIPSIEIASQYFRDLSCQHEQIHFRQIRRGTIHFRMILLDELAFMSPYLYGSGTSPLWHSAVGTALYRTISNEFETLWGLNDPELLPQ